MKHTDNILTGGDGVTGQYGLEVRTRINNQFAVVMGNTEYLPSTFVFTTLNLSPFANKIIEVAFQHDLAGANFTLPNNCTLYFNGGALLNAGTITGNNTKIINPKNLQIFSLATVFAGTWNQIQGCVQWFGGKSQPDITTYTDDVMPALDALLKARWGIFWLMGNYYVGSSIDVRNPVHMELGGAVRPDEINILNRANAWVPMDVAHASEVVRLYSNLDSFNWFEIRSPYVEIIGGIFDIAGAPQWNHSMIYLDGAYSVDHCKFKQTAVGDRHKITAPNQTGHYAFWQSEYATVAGHLYEVEFDADIQYIPIGIEIQQPRSLVPDVRTWANGIHVKGRMHGCKKALIHYSAGMAKIQITTQSDYCLDVTELGFYSVDIKGYQIDLDVFCWDLTGELNPYPPYTGYIGILPVLLDATRVSLLGQSLISYRLGQFRGSKGEAAMIVNSDSQTRYFKDTWSSDVFFSELHNILAGWDKKGSNQIDISGRIGTGYDFDTQLTEGTATINLNFSINDPGNLVTPIGGATNFPTRYQFTTGADIENDFVEIVLTPEITIDISLFFIYLMGNGTVVNRIQVIGTKTNDEIVVYNQNGYSESYRSKHFYEFNIKNTYKKLVIRLIGVTNLNTLVYILDFAGKAGRNKLMVVPEIHDFRYKFTGVLTQTNTNAPVITEILRVTDRPVTASRISTGRYYLHCEYSLTENKTLPVNETTHVYQGVIFVGTIRMSWNNANRFLIETWNASGVLSDSILTNQYVSFNVGW